jgi:outer membrane protein assembly factor BamB
MEIGADQGSCVGNYAAPFGFTGLIGDVKVYHGALGASEVARHHATPGESGAEQAELVLHLSFDKGDATDESGNGNNGTVAGAEPAEGKLGGAMKFVGVATRPSGFFVQHDWAKGVPLLVRAMVLADDTMFIAGPPDLVDEEEAFFNSDVAQIQAKLAQQDAAFDDRKGASLWAVSTSDGEKLAEYKLQSAPVFDGMAAANGRLYLVTKDGKVQCFGG